jgi:hypothetical protein
MAATSVNISGTVTKAGGGPLKDVTVTLAGVTDLSVATDSAGKFTLTTVRALQMQSPKMTSLEFSLIGKTVVFSSVLGEISGNVAVFSGGGKRMASIQFTNLQPGTEKVTLPEFSPGLTIVRVTIDNKIYICPVIRIGNELYLKGEGPHTTADRNFTLAAASINDTLIAKKAGYADKKTPIDSYTMTGVAIAMDSAGSTVNCQLPALPEFSALTSITELPDPFKMMDGTRMTKKSQWECRRAEISALAQKFMYGPKPPKPDKVEATYSGSKLTVKITVGSTTKSFEVTISGNSGTAVPGIIVVGGSFGAPRATYTTPTGVASIICNEQQFAKSDVNGRDPASGIFYDLNPDYKKTGSCMAWAWGIGRLIDAFEIEEIKTATKIDPTKLAITGCSYAGKATLAIGAFEERIALTLPVESGAGGSIVWRVAEELAPPGKSGQNGCQYASETYGESTWMGDAFQQFGNAVNKLPVDMHSVSALCYPRGLMSYGALTAWICPKGCWISGVATHMVYEALGKPDNFGMIVATTPAHCSKGNTSFKEQDTYNAFVKKFLQGDASANTTVLKNDQNYSATDSKYIPWTKPTLE